MAGSLQCSVVIPTYNRVGLLRHTLDSLVGQTLPTDQFEVLVVDDGSSDGTAEMVDTFRGRLNLRYFFQEDEGYRAAKARNVGIAAASSDIVVLIDSGVLAHSGCLQAHVDSHRSTAEPLAVVGYVYCFNLDNEDAILINQAIDFEDPDGTIARLEEKGNWLDIRELFYEMYGDNFGDLPAPWLNYWTCNVSARTDRLRRIGMFDEEFKRWGGEDIDLGYRLFRDGARFVLNRQAAAIHCPHEKSFDGNNEQAAGNYDYMYAKYGTPIIELLTHIGELDYFELNNIIKERGLPRCEDYLAELQTSGERS
ncbi:glycosyltransferase [Acrocarpospora catenulata]|uniref:glycosyltransferase n=1 Tax=Acrocarpospora catenulata TaxID=2836182 RepID=UPI001BDA1A9A|nr:glycosyltransferase [Acrocarpospora catenulata]